MIGQRIRHWTVLGMEGRYMGKRMVLCRCDCGVEAMVDASNLRRGKSTRCRDCAADLRATRRAGTKVSE